MGQKLVIDNVNNIITNVPQQTLQTPQISYISSLTTDILNLIISDIINNGLNLKNYIIVTCVCKLWRELTNNCVTSIDVGSLARTSIHRKSTLLAHIIANQKFLQFNNLTSLKFDFTEINTFEFYQKLVTEEQRNFDNTRSYYSDDKKLERIELDIAECDKEFIQTFRDINTNKWIKIFKGVGFMISTSWNKYKCNNIMGASLKEQSDKNDELRNNIGNIIITEISKYSKLENLNIDTKFSINLEFINKMNKLKRLYIHQMSDDIKCKFNPSCIHNIESLVISGSNNIADPQIWNKYFPNLKEIAIFLGYGQDDPNASTLNELEMIVEHLPNLERLFVKGIHQNRPFQVFSKLCKLEKLDLSVCIPSNIDLMDIAEILSLNELILMNPSIIMSLELVRGYNDYDIEIFKLKRPDVLVTILSK
jgi:hypothetical protein